MYQRPDKDGYKIVRIRKNGLYHTKKVHRLVCEAYHGLPPSGKSNALHNDGNNTNNHPENLRWGDFRENAFDAMDHMQAKGGQWAVWNQGENHTSHKLTEADVIEIRKTCVKTAKRGTKSEMARKLGVSAALITGVLKGTHWKHTEKL